MDLFPKIKRELSDFINDEEGNIARNKVLTIGTMIAIMGIIAGFDVYAKHSSHTSHSSHSSTSYHRSHVSHTSHTSHSNGHGSHSSHSNYHSSHSSHSNSHSSHSSSTVNRYSTSTTESTSSDFPDGSAVAIGVLGAAAVTTGIVIHKKKKR